MRVDAYSKIAQVYQTNALQKMEKKANVSAKDQVEISSMGNDYQIAKKAVSESPDIRADKVQDIKERIASGTYNVNMEEVADNILKKYFEKSI
ncbi:MAG: anti-sigma-28 factor, FlgM [Anaerocolumna sp.]|nr:anti-sigma-28 factor, FlgM [Anaerocolumna sp.]